MTRPRFLCLLIGFLFTIFAALPAQAITWDELLNRPRAEPTKVFHYGSAPDQFAQLWLPEGHGVFPVVVMLHGGCWQESLPGVDLMAYIAEDLRRQGVAVWNVEYRRLGAKGGGYPGTFLDVADAMDYLQRMGIDYGLDLSRIATLGHSAGGQLALWAAARSHLPSKSPLYRKHPQKVIAAVSLAGIDDLALYRQSGPSACGGPATIDALVGRDGKNSYADTSPAALAPLKVPQLVVSGKDDDIVPPVFGAAYAAAATKAGDEAEELSLADAGHFELIDPESAAWAVIRPKILAFLKQKK